MVPVGKSKLMQQLRAELQQIAAQPVVGAADRRAGIRSRSLRALPARAQPAGRVSRS